MKQLTKLELNDFNVLDVIGMKSVLGGLTTGSGSTSSGSTGSGTNACHGKSKDTCPGTSCFDSDNNPGSCGWVIPDKACKCATVDVPL